MEGGVEILTVYAFSTENWKRPKEEIDYLMALFKDHMKQIHKEAIQRKIRIRVLATDAASIPEDIAAVIEQMERDTLHNERFSLNICLSYGARGEIVQAARTLAAAAKDGTVAPDEIDEVMFGSSLLTQGLPDPDLLIRTSGEQRLSNFLLWQLAYSELTFVPKAWPEMTKEDLKGCIHDFVNRGRRFGK